MTEHPAVASPAADAGSAARTARVVEPRRARSTRRRHPAQGARIAAAGLGVTTMLGLVGAMGRGTDPTPSATAPPAATPATQPPVVVVVHPAGAANPVPAAGAASPPATIVLSAHPTVRPASPQPQAPAASTRGSS